MFLNRFRAFRRLSAVRLTLSLLGVFAVITVGAWAATYLLVQREMNRLIDARLYAQLAAVRDALDASENLPKPGVGQQISVVIGGNVRGALSFPIHSQADGIYDFDPTVRGAPEFRYLIANRADGRIVIAELTERQEELRDILAAGMLTSLFGTLGVGALAGMWLAVRGQRRLDIISAGLSKVSTGQLDTRIVLDGRADDLTQLADRINATTAKLEQAMAQMRVQSSNIAHDLRTPLARLRAKIEGDLLALSERQRPVSTDDLGIALEQIDHIAGTFNALLRLSKIESGAGRAGFARIDLGKLTLEVAETFTPVVEAAGQTLRQDLGAAVGIQGDRELIVQMLANLIQNALRYGAEGQAITLSVAGARVSVTDEGPGIPAASREQVLQPLFQLEGSRQNDGFGLGLSMVRAICDLHGATLTLADGDSGRGLAVSVEFPI